MALAPRIKRVATGMRERRGDDQRVAALKSRDLFLFWVHAGAISVFIDQVIGATVSGFHVIWPSMVRV